MSKINLDHIHVPNDLSDVVDASIQKAKAREKSGLNFRRFASVAAIAAVCMLMLNFNTVAAFAKATQQFFTALYNNTFENSSRIEAINNDYFSGVVQTGAVESGGLNISLTNYYIDTNEAGFEFAVIGNDLSKFDDKVLTSNRSITITDHVSGEVQILDNASAFSMEDTRITEVGENTYRLVDVIKFNAPISVGDEITLQYSGFSFIKHSLDNTESNQQYIEGKWDFKIAVDEKFQNADTLQYEIVNGEAALQKGIALESVSISPLSTRLTFAVDYCKSNIADPDNINLAAEPQYAYKLNLMDFSDATAIQVDNDLYQYKSGLFVEQKNGADYCVLEFDTIYFKSVENFNINITERNGEVITLEVVNIK